MHRPLAYNPAMGSSPTRGLPAPVFHQPGSSTRSVPAGIGASAPVGMSGAGMGPSGGFGTQTSGYRGTQTPGYGATQTPGVAGTQAGGPSFGFVLPPGVQNYQPTASGSGQPLGYKSGRSFLPAYSTSPERPPGRIYYPSGGGIPMPPPPPPPPVPHGSPGPRVSYLPVSPIASGTPLSRRSAHEGSMTVPPSPIGE